MKTGGAAAVVFGALLSSNVALAHDYWMVPTPLVGRPDDEVVVSLYVGDEFIAEEEKFLDVARTTRFMLTHDGRSNDLLHAVTDGGGAPILRTRLAAPGGHLLVLDRNAVTIEHSPEKFEHYLSHEALEGPRAERARLGQANQPAREKYTRYLKALIQVGAADDNSFAKTTGQVLEIVPEKNPVFIAPGASLPVRIRFRGIPLSGASFEALSRVGTDVRTVRYTADERGLASVTIDRPGVWLIRMVHMVPCIGCGGADWESFWASYVFAGKPADGSSVVPPPMLVATPASHFRTLTWLGVPLALVALVALAVLVRGSRIRASKKKSGASS